MTERWICGKTKCHSRFTGPLPDSDEIQESIIFFVRSEARSKLLYIRQETEHSQDSWAGRVDH